VVKNGVLILHPHPDSSVPSVTLRNRDDAEIIYLTENESGLLIYEVAFYLFKLLSS